MLKGASDSGKTTTLHLVYEELVNNRHAKVVEYAPLGTPAPNKPQDIACILEYKGLKVAIYTMGDYVRGIQNAIKDCMAKSVDVLIIANSNKPQFDSLMQQPGNILIEKTKAAPALRDTDNMKYAMQIIDAI